MRSPADSSSISVNVNASPADGPPMLPVSMSISNGSSTVAVSNGTNPMIARDGSSGEAISSTSTVRRPSPGRSISSSTVSPACVVGELGDEVVDRGQRRRRWR